MNRTDITNMAMTLTQNKLKGVSADSLLNMRIQKFCQEKRFWWREKAASFPTIAGTATYDLTSNTNGTMTDLDEIIKVIRVDNSTTGDVTELVPIFSQSARLAATLVTTQDDPNNYFIEKNTVRTIRLTPVPKSVKTHWVYYYAVPVTAINDTTATIPLVPEQYHHVLVSGLKMDILEYLFGQESEKYGVAKAEYMDGVYKAEGKPYNTLERKIEWRSRESAVRST